jgi:hypothetical protein
VLVVDRRRNSGLVVMVVMMVREEAVMFVVLVVLVGVSREILLLGVGTDQVLGLVKQRLVGGAGGGAGGAGGVGVLLVRNVVGDGLGGGLVGVGDHVTVRREGQLGVDRWMRRFGGEGRNIPLQLVNVAGDGVCDLVRGGLGVVGSDVVGDL